MTEIEQELLRLHYRLTILECLLLKLDVTVGIHMGQSLDEAIEDTMRSIDVGDAQAQAAFSQMDLDAAEIGLRDGLLHDVLDEMRAYLNRLKHRMSA